VKPKRWQKILAFSIIGVALLFVYAPIFLLILYSFTDSSGGEWSGFGFSAYAEMFEDGDLLRAALNTLILGVASAFIATVIGVFTAIGIFNIKNKWARTAVSGANQITVVNADIVTGVSFMMLFVVLRNIGLNISRGWFTLIVSHVMITVPYVIMAVMPRLRQLNPNIYEAALDLGATPFQATVKVLLPQLLGAAIAGFALAFTLSLDDFVITRYNSGGSLQTISTYLYAMVIKHGILNSFRALSTLLFILILGILILINVKSKPKHIKSKK